MSKVQEYLRNKKIQELGLPKLYIVYSSPEGVKDVVEKQVVEIIENVAFSGNERLPIDRYKLDTSPYEVDILRGEYSLEDSRYGSGFGDLWGHTYFSSFNREESERWYEKESERVSKKYGK